MSDFIEQAEKALKVSDTQWDDASVQILRDALRQAITEVRARDERLSGKDFVIDELRAAAQSVLNLAPDDEMVMRAHIQLDRALNSDAAPSPWRDIESAPKDGRLFLASWDGEVVLALWTCDEWRFVYDHRPRRRSEAPQVWMPLPDGPGDAS